MEKNNRWKINFLGKWVWGPMSDSPEGMGLHGAGCRTTCSPTMQDEIISAQSFEARLIASTKGESQLHFTEVQLGTCMVKVPRCQLTAC
jgi:hypothetical protein